MSKNKWGLCGNFGVFVLTHCKRRETGESPAAIISAENEYKSHLKLFKINIF